jgi:hypothetical protein
MEGIPTMAVPISFGVGLMLVLWFVEQHGWNTHWRYVVVYALACAFAIGAYYVFQFLPDVAASYQLYRNFAAQYSNATGLGSARDPLQALERLLGYATRFTLILSPMELVIGLIAMLALWRVGTRVERRLLVALVIGLVVVIFFLFLSYGYLIAFTPFVAYAVARLYQSRRAVALMSFVMLPALASAPIYDMTWAMQARRNQTRIETLATLTPLFPADITVIGDDLMWYPLHSGRYYIGMNGLFNYVGMKQVDLAAAVQQLDVDVLTCQEGDAQCAPIVATGLFNPPEAHQVGEQTYLVYWR